MGGSRGGRLFEGEGAYFKFWPIGGALIRRGRLFEGGYKGLCILKGITSFVKQGY